MFYGGDFSGWSLADYNAAPARILDAIQVIRHMIRDIQRSRATTTATHQEAVQRAQGWG